MKKPWRGFKRGLTVMMIMAVPMVSAQSISPLQESPYFPFIGKIEALEKSISATGISKGGKHPEKHARIHYGTASWYSESDPGINLHTANGEIFDETGLTCASWHFPFGTFLKVRNEANGKSVICRVNDRGPAKRLNRLIDLTREAFGRVGPLRKGLIQVSVTPLEKEK